MEQNVQEYINLKKVFIKGKNELNFYHVIKKIKEIEYKDIMLSLYSRLIENKIDIKIYIDIY